MRKSIKTAAVVAAMSVMVLGTVASVSAAEKKNGWVKENSDWYYYSNDKAMINAWVESNGKWYFLDDDGKMATKKFIDDGSIVEKTDVASISPSEDDLYYYVGADGAMVTGWNQIDVVGENSPTSSSKQWFYMSTTGRIYGDEWVSSGSTWYYLTNNGQMLNKKLTTIDGVDYYFKDGGAMISGWYKLVSGDVSTKASDNRWTDYDAGDWVYADEDGELIAQGWEKIDDKWYYFGSVIQGGNDINTLSDLTGTATGKPYLMVTDTFIKDENGKNFFVKSNGQMATAAWVKSKNTAKDYFYAKSNGELYGTTVESISSKYYSFENGVMVDDAAYTYAYKYYTQNASGATVTNYGKLAKSSSYSSVSTAWDYIELAANNVLPAGATLKNVYKLGSNASK